MPLVFSEEPVTDVVTAGREALVNDWTLPPYLTFFSLLAVGLYIRGWRRGHVLRPAELPAWRAACFCSGILSFWLAIASPIGAFDDVFLTAHMVQHLILMSVAPPLILLGAPSVPFLRGMPRAVIRGLVGPLLKLRVLRQIGHGLFHPVTGWLALNLAYLGWHIPGAYELALRSDAWHEVEHACFFSTSVLFWWNVVQPWPSRTVWSRWATIPYLLTADLVNTGLSAFFAFCGRVLYASYANQPRIGSISPLDDQKAAGAFMWVVGSLLYLIPAVAIVFHLLNSRSELTLERTATRTPPLVS
jgi:putative membrane protein